MSPVVQAVLSGVLIFVVGQVLVKLALEPVQELRRLVGEIGTDLIFFANVYASPGSHKPETANECSDTLRKHASRLVGAALLLGSFHWVLGFLRVVPTLKNIVEARSNLIGLSNSVHRGEPLANDAMRTKVQEALRIPADLR